MQAEQTGISGRVSEEFNCLPVENEEFRQISEKRALEALKPKRETVFIDKLPGKLLQARHALPGDKGAFVVSIPLTELPRPDAKLTYPANNKTIQSARTRKQNHAHAPKRTPRSHLPVFPRVQILAI